MKKDHHSEYSTANVHFEGTPAPLRTKSRRASESPSRPRGSGALHFFVKARLFAMLLLVTFCGLLPESAVFGETTNTADQILSQVRHSFPRQPVTLTAQLKTKGRDRKDTARYQAELKLDWGGSVPTAAYRISDHFGTPLEKLTLNWSGATSNHAAYFTGPNESPQPLPPLTQAIQQTDFTWLDLSLDFLWWSDGERVGEDEWKNRRCHIIKLPAPAALSAHINTITLWVDQTVPMLLKAETYGPDGALTRRLQVNSFKKINGEYMVQDIEVKQYPSRHKTTLRVKDFEIHDLDSSENQ